MTDPNASRTLLLPDLGEGLVDAKVLDWLVEDGETVERGDPLVEVETAKSAVEIPSPWTGRVLTRHAEPGERLDVGRPLITLAVEGAAADPADAAGTPQAPETGQTADAAPAPSPGIVGTVPADRAPRRRVRLTPPKED
ncbi:biotin/lipoyl-containing protein [Phaeacidiphilus oryzae]|jgi:pyruvate dehydrogenase E2 component (dihydrolipoamide acetyltransferase)|uniref:biotin/lipoyl-containing protein n=1 Tax=Phaeacidiphilus oryzae TaxID=348818 RepID=UPI000559F53F|nr:biotin/lipoyl-containing protein [Phaeacidiphilus oryzae]